MDQINKKQSLCPHISVCICTYKRPGYLANLLKKLEQQETEGLFTYSLIVVDNDRMRSAEQIVNEHSFNSKLDIRYFIEERKNISLARNKAISNSTGQLIAFIDDDEIPESTWLLTLFKAFVNFNADAILGPVFPIYESLPPKWVIKGKFFQRPFYKTGYNISWVQGRTGNILINKSLFESTGIFFDPKFGQAGEDQEFTRALLEKGYIFIWCNEARVYEVIPPIRWNIINMLKIAFKRGEISVQHPGSKIKMILISLFASLIYMLSLPILILIGYEHFVSYSNKLAYHIGKLFSLYKIYILNKSSLIC